MGKRKRLAKGSRKLRAVESKAPVLHPSALFARPEINSRIQYTFVPIFPPEHPLGEITRSPEGSRGVYRVTFLMSVPGKNVFRDELNFVHIMKTGDSLLHVSPGINLKVVLSGDKGIADILFMSNAEGRIATAQMRIDAPNFAEAERSAYNYVAPQLSYWSYLYDVAIDIAGYQVVEESTETKMYSFGALGRVKLFDNDDEFVAVPAYRRFFAAYREGMSATNVFYQALSFYKVAEGVRAERVRETRRTGTVKKGGAPIHTAEKFPDDIAALPVTDELSRAAFEPYLGMDYDSILLQFKDFIRNAIAHLSQLDDVLDADRFEDVAVCLRAIPVLRYIARQMLSNDLKAARTS